MFSSSEWHSQHPRSTLFCPKRFSRDRLIGLPARRSVARLPPESGHATPNTIFSNRRQPYLPLFRAFHAASPISVVKQRVCPNSPPFSRYTLELIITYLVDPSFARRRAGYALSVSSLVSRARMSCMTS